MKTKSILSLLFISSVSMACGNIIAVESKTHIDAELAPYVQTVMGWSGEEIATQIYSIRLVDSLSSHDNNSSALAACSMPDPGVWYPHSRSIEVVNRESIFDKEGYPAPAWKSLDDNARLMLIAHELGHCQWNVAGHDTSGLMQPELLAGDAKTAFMEFYNNLRTAYGYKTR